MDESRRRNQAVCEEKTVRQSISTEKINGKVGHRFVQF